MLVDCGYHSQGKGKWTDVDLVKQIKKDLDGEPINVLVATHRHQDHISGFGEDWSSIDVEEVWLPFTVGPDAVNKDPSLKAWHGMMESAETLLSAGRLTPEARSALSARDAAEQEEVEFMLWNARANAPGIQNLLSGMGVKGSGGAKRRFLPEDETFPSKVVTPRLPGVVTHVLGPPRDPSLRKSKKVPASWGVKEDQPHPTMPSGAVGSPFGEEWRLARDRLPPRLPFQPKTLGSIRKFNDDLFRAAKAVDGFLNGESLVLVIEFGAARLLLPGDAEVGSWTAILGNPEALALASSATFLKVGHHGSHNATPLVFMREHLARRTPAVISTQEGPGKYRNGIPFPMLLDTMKSRELPFVRSDLQATAAGIFTAHPEQLWVDCAIPC